MSWERLGIEIRARRRALGLKQPQVAARGGPSVETLRALENNRSGRLSERLRSALERALEWEAGSVDAVLDGGEPRILEQSADARRSSADTVAAAPVAGGRLEMAEQVVAMVNAFVRIRDSVPEEEQEAVRRSARDTEDAIIRMMSWLTEEERGHAIRILGELRQV